MEDLMCKIGSEPTYTFIAAIAVVILLFIVLLVVISSMRIKTYKDRFINTKIDNQEKEAQIAELQKELQELKIVKAQNEQSLQSFAETRKKLSQTEETLATLQRSNNELEKLQGQTLSKLEHITEKYEDLDEGHIALQARFDALQEENSKLHINNARLLMKLETEARLIMQKQQQKRNNEENS